VTDPPGSGGAALVLRVRDTPYAEAVVVRVLTTFAARAALPVDRVRPLAAGLSALVASGDARGSGGGVDLEAELEPAGLCLRVRGLAPAAAEQLARTPPAALSAHGERRVIPQPGGGASVELRVAW
jgi:hypothetical protein